jgi:hypothetical protein
MLSITYTRARHGGRIRNRSTRPAEQLTPEGRQQVQRPAPCCPILDREIKPRHCSRSARTRFLGDVPGAGGQDPKAQAGVVARTGPCRMASRAPGHPQGTPLSTVEWPIREVKMGVR